MMRRLVAVVLLVGCVAGARPAAQRATPSEYDVKAAYLLSFGKFVQWPPGPRRSAPTFDLCVLGGDPFGPSLDSVVAGAVIAGRGVQAHRISRPAEANGCHVLYVAESDTRQVPALLAALSPADVLTVGDSPQFLEGGGMIRFVTQGGRVRFEVDLRNAQAAGLVLSSDLLRVASAVRRERP